MPALAAAAFVLTAAAPPLTFETIRATHQAAAAGYRNIWCAEGARIVAAMERVTGFAFPATPIRVVVADGTPMTAYDGRTIWLKAGYPAYYKQATLIHELGHRLSFTMPRTADLDDHRLLDLFLYDVWTDLYGRDYADRMVNIERQIRGRYDYAGAWNWALAMTREQRQARLAALRGAGGVPAPTPGRPAAPPGCGAPATRNAVTPTRLP